MPDAAVTTEAGYFPTPERDERLQLTAHLLRNAAEPVYLRGPAGAGKTRFCQRLLEELGGELADVRLVGTEDLDVHSAVQAQLRRGGPPPERDGAKPVLILVDNADALTPPALEALYALQRDGARLLLCGRGQEVPPAGPAGLHLVDLPPFTPLQCRDFLVALDPVLAERLGEQGRASLCAQAEGWPGRILQRLGAAGARPEPAAMPGGPWRLWVGGVLLLGLVAVVLWQQDAINAWFEGPPPSAEPEQPPLVDASKPQLLELPPPAARPATAPDAGPPSAGGAATDAESDLAESPPLAAVTGEVAVALPPEVPGPEAAVAAAPGGSTDPMAAGDAPSSDPTQQAESEPAGVAAEAPPAAVDQPADQAPQAPTTRPTAPAEAQPEPAVATAPPPPIAASADPPSLPGTSWLRAQPAEYYTLQLLGARDLAAIRRFANTHGLQGNYAVVVRDLKGKPWYSLVYGSFADREQALRRKGELGSAVAKDAWPRRFAELR